MSKFHEVRQTNVQILPDKTLIRSQPQSVMGRKKLKLLALLVLMVAVASCMTDMYLPALPLMQRAFHTTARLSQSTMVLYLLGYSVFQLVYGPISDRLGRRRVVCFGLLLGILGSYCCVVAYPHLWVLMLGRLLQGIGMAAPLSMARAMMSDCFEGETLAKVASYLSLVIGFIPMFAPALGGMVTHYWGWQVNFDVMLCASIAVTVLVAFALVETLPVSQRVSHSVLRKYREIMQCVTFWRYGLLSGLGYAGIMVVMLILPFVAEQHWHMSPHQYGYVALLIASSMVVGKLLNTRLLKVLDSDRIIILSYVAMLLVGLGLALLYTAGVPMSPDLLIPILFLYFLAAGMIFPNATAMVFKPFRHMAGSVSALYGCLQIMLCVVAQRIAIGTNQHLLALVASVLILAVLGNVVIVALFRSRRRAIEQCS